MGRGISLIIALAVLLSSIPQSAAVTIDWVPVGNAGNANDPATGNLYGGVAYNYSIDKYDVTIGQYTDFLNAVAATDRYGLYNTGMHTDQAVRGINQSGSPGSYTYSVIGTSANLPITYVSWGDAARFANWLSNGQPGLGGPGVPQNELSTELGSYTMNGALTGYDFTFVTRSPSATIVIPTQNEWYKATYYDPALNNGAGGYYLYPFSSNTVPTSAPPGGTPNTGNFVGPNGYAVTGNQLIHPLTTYLTPVGAYTASASPYGAFDMGGNVLEYDENLITDGASWFSQSTALASASRGQPIETNASFAVGFRVALVPEPSTAILALFGFAGLAASAWRYRKSQRAVS